MDEAFLIRAKRLLGQRAPARLDHDSLAAAVTARQAETPAAQAAARAAEPAAAGLEVARDSLADLLAAGRAGPAPGRGRRGCFNRAVATRSIKDR